VAGGTHKEEEEAGGDNKGAGGGGIRLGKMKKTGERKTMTLTLRAVSLLLATACCCLIHHILIIFHFIYITLFLCSLLFLHLPHLSLILSLFLSLIVCPVVDKKGTSVGSALADGGMEKLRLAIQQLDFIVFD